MRRRSAVIFLAVVLAAALAAAGCGGGDDEEAATTDIFETGILDTGETEVPPLPPVETTETTPEVFQITVPEDAPIGPQSPSEKIAEVQRALLLLGYKIGKADGIWGPKTRNAVIKFQKKHKLDADGLVGARTAKVINRELRTLGATTG